MTDTGPPLPVERTGHKTNRGVAIGTGIAVAGIWVSVAAICVALAHTAAADALPAVPFVAMLATAMVVGPK